MPAAHSIKAFNLHFDYNQKTSVFEDHSINLAIPPTQENKLYGIIGPSGTGKTTLVSILGGQLKPTSGQILIDDVDIYKVGDLKRRELICLQMQTSTSLRGKLKYNLIFGLPDTWAMDENYTPIYTDQYLVEVLKNVGLWSIFETKDGLDTLIGEGGLNLSGGQRQRLNFAGLYLRALYFNPTLILIDEPTSSLDEISELAITKMINDLSQMAVTLVVAHRLKTLDQSVAIFDTSMVDTQKEMKFMNRQELFLKSRYYQDLIAGKALLDQ